MSEEYQRIVERLARINDLLKRRQRLVEETQEDIKLLTSEQKSLNADLLTLHLEGKDD